jgi:hypothetical protein
MAVDDGSDADLVQKPLAPRAVNEHPTRQHKKIKIEYKARKSSRRPVHIFISPGVMAALASIVGGGIWFAVLVANDRPAIFPMIFVMLGVLRLIRGLRGHPEE